MKSFRQHYEEAMKDPDMRRRIQYYQKRIRDEIDKEQLNEISKPKKEKGNGKR